MAMTPEALVKREVKKILDRYGAYYFMPVTGGFGKGGVPDIIGCLNGTFFGIECKARTNTPTALQLREIERIQAVGGIALVVNRETLEGVTLMCEQLKSNERQSHN